TDAGASPQTSDPHPLGQLNVIGLGGAGERAREPEAPERRLGHALDAGRVGGFAARVRVVGVATDLDGVLRRAVAGDADQVQVKRPAQRVQARGQRGLDADAVVGAWSREEPVGAFGRARVGAYWTRVCEPV